VTSKVRNENLFWYWINERHRIYLARQEGKKWPWTNDPILKTYKFTNVFRELDKETIRLHKRIDPLRSREKRFYGILLFRMFNRADTYDAIHKNGADHRFDAMRRILKKRQAEKYKIFTGAYIITNSGMSISKIELAVSALKELSKGAHSLLHSILAENTLEGAVHYLCEYPMMGKFTSYEVACDMRYQHGMLDKATDIMTWANPGPGAKRGICRILYDDFHYRKYGMRQNDYIEEMQRLLARSPKKLNRHVPPLEMREIEHSLCEFDKYMRVMKREGRPRSVYKPPKE
jgi:hypothetical protein